MADLLRTKQYPRGHLIDEILFRLSPQAGPNRMPLAMNITDEERLSLEEYFRSLSTSAR